jgi:hypothetical protein
MKQFVLNNATINGIVYKTENVIIQRIQKGEKRERCYIIGNGHSLDVDYNDVVIKHDPGMHKFQPKISKDDTVYAFYFTFECLGLEEASKEIARFVNNLSEEYKQLFLVGHSKCGLCLYNASHYCEKSIILVTISTPFGGTVIADKETVEKKLNSQILKKIYNMIFSDHAVDRDIIPNSYFIQNIQSPVYNEHINIVSSLKNVFSCRDIMDLLLFIWDRIMRINGDGLVSFDSQQINSTRAENIICSHANSLKKGIEIIKQI